MKYYVIKTKIHIAIRTKQSHTFHKRLSMSICGICLVSLFLLSIQSLALKFWDEECTKKLRSYLIEIFKKILISYFKMLESYQLVWRDKWAWKLMMIYFIFGISELKVQHELINYFGIWNWYSLTITVSNVFP